MAKQKAIEVKGTVIEALPSTKFKVQLDVNDHVITCSLAGKLRQHYIRIIPGDKVSIEMSPYDMTQGRISYRYENKTADSEQ